MCSGIITKISAVCLFIALFYNKIAAQQSQLDSAKKVFATYSDDEEKYIQASFFIADQYMELEQYDSAQEWLNKIHDKIPAKKASLFNYFLTSRQAEVYYYNNLQQLGLQESFRGLQIAQNLKDSLLLMDSYNFLGIFSMNLDSLRNAVSFFRTGLTYISQQLDTGKYIALSKPLHLYGNLSETYHKMKKYDSALYFIKISLQLSNNQLWGRGIAAGHTSAGDIFIELNQLDSALVNYRAGKEVAESNKDIDIELLCLAGIARVFNVNGNYQNAIAHLDSGLVLLTENPNINRFFTLQFLNTAVLVYESGNDKDRLVRVLKLKSKIESESLTSNNNQVQSILESGVANEKRLLTLEVNEANHNKKLANTRLLIAVVAFVLFVVGFILYRNLQLQKHASAALRQKISQDLHDDIGASLSSLHIYSSIAEKNIYSNPAKAEEMLHKIYLQSQFLMDEMNDIVWSMKPASVGGTTLEAQVKNFGVDLLNNINVNFTYLMDPEVENFLQSFYVRRNLLLIIKEAINNLAKHSHATMASLKLAITGENIELIIKDNGVGFDMNGKKDGNGLTNLHNRVAELHGEMKVRTVINEGTEISIHFPKSFFRR